MPNSVTLVSGFVAAAIVSMAFVLWFAQGDANEDGLVLAVFPPMTSEATIMRSIALADGTYVRASLPASIIIAHSSHPGFADRLKSNGAWLTYSEAPFGDQLAGCMALATDFDFGSIADRRNRL
ncbi:MAG: hypothetical protein AAF739_01130 [Pseudomonadota bacterium]